MFDAKKQFEENVELNKQVDILFNHCRDLDRGDTLTYLQIENLTWLRSDPKDYDAYNMFQYAIKKLRDRLLKDRRIDCFVDNRVGVRFCTIDEQLHEKPLIRNRRALRQLSRSQKSLQALRHEDNLSDYQIDAISRKQEKITRERGLLLKDNKSNLFRPVQTSR